MASGDGFVNIVKKIYVSSVRHLVLQVRQLNDCIYFTRCFNEKTQLIENYFFLNLIKSHPKM